MMPHIEPTDEIGRVIDFSVLKDRIGGWIDEHWDHAMLWYMEDLTLFNLYRTSGPLHQMKNMALDRNPTAENMAQFLLDYSNSTLLHGLPIKVTEVVLWETENCYATATG
jgi:6-pyruvoyltetrahydropterin/6-carboxytetrahydropterin synthase